jgi:hypothetical protein
MGAVESITVAKWTQEQDDIVLNCMLRARENNVTNESAFLAATEQIGEILNIERTVKSVGERYYYLKRKGAVSPLVLPDREEDEQGDSAMDLASMFVEMRKIVRERDDLRAKYQDALAWKLKYEEISKKMAKIEKEAASFMDLMRKQG